MCGRCKHTTWGQGATLREQYRFYSERHGGNAQVYRCTICQKYYIEPSIGDDLEEIDMSNGDEGLRAAVDACRVMGEELKQRLNRVESEKAEASSVRRIAKRVDELQRYLPRDMPELLDGPNPTIPPGAQASTCGDCGWTYGSHSPTCAGQDTTEQGDLRECNALRVLATAAIRCAVDIPSPDLRTTALDTVKITARRVNYMQEACRVALHGVLSRQDRATLTRASSILAILAVE